MECIITKAINRTVEREINQLYLELIEKDPIAVSPLCSTKELAGIVTFLLYNDDHKLIALLSAYEVEEGCMEISAFTHPDFRRQGCFHRLYREFLSYYPAEARKDVSFQCDDRCKDLTGCLQHLGCTFEDTEYLLVCHEPKKRIPMDTSRPDPRILEFYTEGCSDLKVLAAVHAHVFDLPIEESREFLEDIKVIPGIRYELIYYHNEPAGCFFLQPTMKATYLFGFGIIPEIRGKGYSDIVMRWVFRTLPGFCEDVTVQVSKSNERAFALYKKFGFEVKEALSIYHMPENYQ